MARRSSSRPRSRVTRCRKSRGSAMDALLKRIQISVLTTIVRRERSCFTSSKFSHRIPESTWRSLPTSMVAPLQLEISRLTVRFRAVYLLLIIVHSHYPRTRPRQTAITSTQNPTGISVLICLCGVNNNPITTHFFICLVSASVSGGVNTPL